MDELNHFWESTLKLDLLGFADPKTAVDVQVDGRSLNAKWIQRGRERSERFKLTGDGDFRWIDDDSLKPYSIFLMSPKMADFEQLAAAMRREFSREPHYIATTVEVSTEDVVNSDDFLLTAVQEGLQDTGGFTRMLFVKGDAGAGKTTLLREIVAAQAERFEHGNAEFLFLLINAQGRALSSLRDALAGELQDLRAGFVRDAVPALSRRGVLVPIIDGFDELLGAAGYGDAFGSLQQFLGELDGHGVMIVSARSSFYDVEFLAKDPGLEDKRASYEVEPVTLRPWPIENIERYLAKVRGNEQITVRDRAAIDGLDERDRQLLTKPFFASRFPGYVDAPIGEGEQRPLLQFLIDSYLRRETEKIVDRERHPLLSMDGHRRLFEEAAEAMWQGENRRLKAGDLRGLAELIASEFALSSDAAKQFVTKITSSAGFRTAEGSSEKEFTFEHEVYFDHFLSSSMQRQLKGKTIMPSIFARGILPDDVVRGLIDDGKDAASQWISALKNLARPGILDENVRRNVGQILAAAFEVSREVRDIQIGPASFINVSFGRCSFYGVTFNNCHFAATHFEYARFENCRAVDCQADHLLVSRQTRFDIDGFVPGSNLTSLVRMEDGEIYMPTEIYGILRELGAPLPAPPESRTPYTRKGLDAVELLKKVGKKYEYANVLCLQDDRPNVERLFRDASWTALHRLLVQHGIVGEEHRSTSGPKKTFLRLLVSLPTFMRHEAEASLPADGIGDFWRALRRL